MGAAYRHHRLQLQVVKMIHLACGTACQITDIAPITVITKKCRAATPRRHRNASLPLPGFRRRWHGAF